MGSPGPRGFRAAFLPVRRQMDGAMRRLNLVLVLFVVAVVGLAEDTGWLDPSADGGQFLGGPGAYAPGGLYAVGADAEHRYWRYGISLPVGTEIVGIEVLVRARRAPGWTGELRAELSADGGLTWTATGNSTGRLHPLHWREYVLGGSADPWGRTWTGDELADGSFRVRVRAEGYVALDWVAVRVHYREGISQTLTVAPLLVDLGAVALADYDRGFRDLSPAQRVTVTSGAPWSLYVAAETPTWNYSGPEPSPAKPCEHLEWRVVGTGPTVTAAQTAYQGLTTTPALVATGTGQTAVTWVDIALLVRVDYDTVPPGTYELRFTYTLTAP